MAWEDDLQEASMDGIPFPVSERSRSGTRDAARVKPPYQDGQGVEPTGLGPAVYRITIPLFPDVEGYEDLYPGTYRDLIALFKNSDRPTFEYVDPIDGGVNVFCAEWDEAASADARDGVLLTVQLEEVTLEVDGNLVFSATSPASAGREAAAEADESMEAAGVDEETVQSSMQTEGVGLGQGDTQAAAGTTFSTLWSDFETALSEAQARADEVEGIFATYRARVRAVINRVDAVRSPAGWPLLQALLRCIDSASTASQRAVARSVPIQDYTVAGPCTAMELAVRLYGDRTRAAEIVDLNPGVNPLRIPTGMVLRVKVR